MITYDYIVKTNETQLVLKNIYFIILKTRKALKTDGLTYYSKV